MYSDASTKGWGGQCNGKVAAGIFTQEEIAKHINWLELLAAFLCLKSFVKTTHIFKNFDNVMLMASQ